MHIEPTPAQVETFVGGPGAGPLFMLNLLKFKDVTDRGGTGAEVYGQYALAVQPHLERVGGALMWAGLCDEALIGPVDGEWDMVAVVRYPDRQAFLAMIGDPSYLETAELRSASLADSRLVPCIGVAGPS